MAMKGRRLLIGAVCFLVAVLSLSVLLGSPKNLGRHSVEVSDSDEIAFAKAMLRRGMIDAASHRLGRARRAFNAARRAAANDAEFKARIDAVAAKLEPLSRTGNVK